MPPATLITGALPRAAARGFTLIELMMVLVIVAILIAVALPNMTDFVAEQRVRTVASDMASEIAFARAKAVELSQRVVIERIGATGWDQGWRTYVDVDSSGGFGAGDTLIKEFNGFGTGVGTTTGRLYICGLPAVDFGSRFVFRPDGRVVRSNAATAATDGIYVIDPMGDTDPCNNKTRAILFDLSGRVHSRLLTSGSASCKGIAPPC